MIPSREEVLASDEDRMRRSDDKKPFLHDLISYTTGLPAASIMRVGKKCLPDWLLYPQYYLRHDDVTYLSNIYRHNWGSIISFNAFGIRESVPQIVEIDNFSDPLPGNNFIFRPQERSFVPDAEIVGHTDALFRRLRWFMKIHRQTYFNGTLLRLADIKHKNGKVEMVCEATKYETVCRTSLLLDARETPNSSSLREIVHPDGKIGSLSGSRLANAIGVDCLLFTADHRLVMPMRSARVAVNPKRLSPSFSGDMEYTDVTKPGIKLDSFHVLREGMEELNLNPEDVDREGIVFLGLARDLLRGGKPQMFFAARTTLTKEQLLKRHPNAIDEWEFHGRSRQKQWAFWEFPNDILRTDSSSHQRSGRIAECARDMFSTLGRNMSMPLRTNVLLWLRRELGGGHRT